MMNTRHIAGLSRRLHQTMIGLRRNNIYYVSDTANWSFHWDAQYITSGLRDHVKLHAYITHDPWKLKHQIIHFGNRYAFFDGPFRYIHPSNQVFLTWFHGDRDDPNPRMQRLFTMLPDIAGYVRKIVVTCGISQEILTAAGIPAPQIVTIPLGVDLGRFFALTAKARAHARAAYGIPEGTLCIGSFQKDGNGWDDGAAPKLVKGPDIFLDTVAQVAARVKNVLVLLTGPARGYVKQGLEKLGVPYRHHMLADYHEIVQYYQLLDLYLITSRAEGGPKALLESWATGVPLVASRVGMAADLIRSGSNGMLADVEDVAGLVEGAMALLEDAPLRERCRLQALRDVQQYDWSRIAEDYYHKLYQPIVG